jgi:hypothetical protein
MATGQAKWTAARDLPGGYVATAAARAPQMRQWSVVSFRSANFQSGRSTGSYRSWRGLAGSAFCGMASRKARNEVERSRWWRARRVAGAVLASTATVWPVAAAAVAHGRDVAPSMVGATARVVLSTEDMSRALAAQPPVTFQSRAPTGAEVVHVNDRHTYQAFLGAGAAMTDTSA